MVVLRGGHLTLFCLHCGSGLRQQGQWPNFLFRHPTILCPPAGFPWVVGTRWRPHAPSLPLMPLLGIWQPHHPLWWFTSRLPQPPLPLVFCQECFYLPEVWLIRFLWNFRALLTSPPVTSRARAHTCKHQFCLPRLPSANIFIEYIVLHELFHLWNHNILVLVSSHDSVLNHLKISHWVEMIFILQIYFHLKNF